MTDLLFQLINRIIDLAKRREQQRVDFFKHFVEPAWKDFEAVHENYLATFRKYLDLVADQTVVLDEHHPVFRALEMDSLFSDAMRSRLAEVTRVRIEDERVAGFVHSIVSYLRSFPENSLLHAVLPDIYLANRDPSWGLPMCLPRISLKHELGHAARREITADERRALARMCISAAVEDLQEEYRTVLNCFGSLKSELLRHAKRI